VNRVLIFAERMLPSTQTFVPIQVNALKKFESQYIGLIPAQPSCTLNTTPILLTESRSLGSRVRREAYRWTGIAPNYHARIGKIGATLLHAHFAEGASSAVAISAALRIPMVLHLRGGAEIFPDQELRRHAYQLPYLFWRRRLWAHASAFLCVSDFIRRKALAAGFPHEKLRVHYTGIDFSRFSPSHSVAAKDKNLVLYVGRLVPYKAADHLIRAMHIVRQTCQGAHLVVIGDGSFLPTVRALACELGVPCQFLGEQPPDVIRTWLERARVFCGPSLTHADGMSEAFGNVFTEAQAMGVPVVSYRHGGIPETMLDGETGLLANEGDHNQLAAQLSRYLADDGFWSRSRELGMRWVREHFDVFKQTSKLESLYDEIIAANPVNAS
jgi:colanic acid/amylovoran biosynthesis glycosyltransferase